MAHTAITNAQVAVDAPLDTALITALRDNADANGVYGLTWTDKTGSRSLDTVYQNTSGHPLWVSVSGDFVQGGDGAALQAFVGSSSPPTVEVVKQQGYNSTANAEVNVFFVVPDDHYYEVNDDDNGTVTVQEWAELE